MKYKIAAEVVQDADKCNLDYSCLNGDKECLCDVNKAIDDKIVLVVPRNNDPCDYLMSFGNSYICNCPVRLELFRSYRV